MEYRNLGRTGLKVSALCLGTMQFGWSADEPTAHTILSAAFEAGINFIDTADIYSRWVPGNPGGVSEEMIGRWMKSVRIPREKVILATKVRGRMGDGPNDEGLGRVHVMNAVDASLRRLQTEYIDLYQTHWSDENTPIEETMRAMDDLVKQGKVRYVGASNYQAWELMQALWTSDKFGLVRYDSLQPHYNLIHREEFERELRAVCKNYGLGVVPYSPLAGGFLTGKYRKGQPMPDSVRVKNLQKAMTERNFALIEKLDEIAKGHSATISQVVLAWMLADPLISSPIIGANSLAQLSDNLGVFAVKLSEDEIKQIAALSDWKV
jgi:aryl-alcohol dehydrogenase-like predicted oxidoreductase